MSKLMLKDIEKANSKFKAKAVKDRLMKVVMLSSGEIVAVDAAVLDLANVIHNSGLQWR